MGAKLVYFLLSLTKKVVILLSVVLTSVVLYGIFRRYLLHKSVPWVEELAIFLMIWIAFLGISIAAHARSHVGVSFVQDLLPPPVRRHLQAGLTLLMVGFLLVVAYQSFLLSIAVLPQRSPALRVSFFWPYISICVGSLLTIVQLAFVLHSDRKTPSSRGTPG